MHDGYSFIIFLLIFLLHFVWWNWYLNLCSSLPDLLALILINWIIFGICILSYILVEFILTSLQNAFWLLALCVNSQLLSVCWGQITDRLRCLHLHVHSLMCMLVVCWFWYSISKMNLASIANLLFPCEIYRALKYYPQAFFLNLLCDVSHDDL